MNADIQFNLLLDGDSRTDGWNCKEEEPYMDYLHFNDSVHVDKISYGGATSWELNHRSVDVYSQRYRQGDFNVVVLWVGVNDMVVHNRTAADVFKNLVEYCEARKAQGWDVILCTEVSMKGAYNKLIFDYERLALNDSIRNHWRSMASGVADLGQIQELGVYDAWKNPEYFCDGIHLTNHGSHLVAGVIQQAFYRYRMMKMRTLPITDKDNLIGG